MSVPPDEAPPPLIPVRNWPTRSQWITFGVLLAISILLVFGTFGPLWKPLFIACVLAGALSNLHERLAQRLKQRRYISSMIFTMAVVVLILIPLVTVVVIAVDETISAIEFVRETLEAGGTRELVAKLPESVRPGVTYALNFLSSRASSLSSELTSSGQMAMSIVRDAVSTTGTILFDATMMLIAFNYLLADGQRLIAWLQDASPLKARQTAELLREFHRTSRSALGSMTATAAAQAATATLGYVIAGIPQPFFFGLLTFITSFIPSIGTALIAIPLAGMLLLLGKTGAGIFLAIYSAVVVGLIDNLLKPLLMRGGMRIHGAVIFFALVGGIVLFGPVGLFVGPLSVTFFLSMIRLGQRDFSPNS